LIRKGGHGSNFMPAFFTFTVLSGKNIGGYAMQKHYGVGHIKRLKERFLEGKTVKYEIIELLLSYAVKGRDVKPQAKEIYSLSDGNFRKVFDVVENMDIEGVGQESRMLFSLIRKFVELYSQEAFLKKTYRAGTQADIISYFKNVCADARRESVHVIFLDAKNKISGNKKICDGTLTQSLLYPREIISEAIKMGALSIVIVHNHPSGDPSPSENDRKITRKLLFATKEMDVGMLDHIIIGTEGKGYYSFYEDGIIAKYNDNYRYMLEQINNI
jgi:DNA repair protein RadC